MLDSLNKASGGKAEPLWQDNWDDDDVEDDFTKQLRYVLLLRSSLLVFNSVKHHAARGNGHHGMTTWVDSSFRTVFDWKDYPRQFAD